MDKAHVQTDVISLNPENKISKDGAKIKCRGPLLLSNSFGNVHSRYLREPIGSCHNLCKYGRKHESEHDEKRLTFRRFIANKMEYSDTSKVVEQNIQPERVGISDKSVGTNVLTLLSKHRRSASSPQFILPEDSGLRAGSLVKEIGLFDNSTNIVSEVNSPTHGSTESFEKDIFHRISEQKIQAQVENDEKDQIQSKKIVESENNIDADSGKSIETSPRVILPGSPDNEMDHGNFLNNCKNKKKINKPKASPMPKSTPAKNILKQNYTSASTEADFGGNTNISEKKVLSSPNELNRSTTVEVIKQKNIVIGKQSASSKLQSSNQNASLPSMKTDAIPLNVRIPPLRSISQLNTSRSMNGRMNQGKKSLNSVEMPEVGERKLLKPQRTSISSTMPSCSTVSLKARKSRHEMVKKSGKTKMDSGDFKDKILKVIEPKRDGKVLKRQENLTKGFDVHASDSAVCEAAEHSLNGQNQRKYKRCTASKVEDKIWARRIPAVRQPADGSSSPYKLKFKKGKVIELQTADSVVPKRGRFRRGRVLGENPSDEVAKRSFRRKKDVGASNEHNSEANAVMMKKVKLQAKIGTSKFQDELGKKEIRALFNQMIEETVSKLVETRKSKVKALVGAFETVISLQESKPASVAYLRPPPEKGCCSNYARSVNQILQDVP